MRKTSPNFTKSSIHKVRPIHLHQHVLTTQVLHRRNDHTKTTKLTHVTEALEQNLSALSIEAQKRAQKDSEKKAAKAAASEAKAQEQRATSKVLIKRIERNKRKYVTAVQGLEQFNLDIKKVAKDFGKKFATGASVTKVPGGGEEITVQGDLSDDIFDFLLDTYPDVPEDNVECVEEKKKKSAAAATG